MTISPRRSGLLVAAALLSLQGVGVAQADALLPRAVGVTQIVLDGTSGIRVEIPYDLRANDYTLEAVEQGASHAYVLIGSFCSGTGTPCGGSEPGGPCPGHGKFCVAWTGTYVSEHDDNVWYHRSENPIHMSVAYHPGNSPQPDLLGHWIEIYAVSDARVTVTIRLKNAVGSARFIATGGIDAGMVKIPERCLRQMPCEQSRVGGMRRDFGTRTIAGGVAWSLDSIQPTSDLRIDFANWLGACMSPDPFGPQDISSDPADHPDGCNLHSESDAEWQPVDDAGFVASGFSGGPKISYQNYDVTGPLYFGFRAMNPSETATHWSVGAYYTWVTLGIDCPSADFSDCNAA